MNRRPAYDRLEPAARRRIWPSLPAALVAGLAYWASERGLLSMSPDAIFAGTGMAFFGAIRKAVRNPELFLGRLMKVCPGSGAGYAEAAEVLLFLR